MKRKMLLALAILACLLPLTASAEGNYTANGDGTVTDNDTGLMWQQGYSDSISWPQALAYCENLDLAGHTDWRLPNIKELQSILDHSRTSPSINTAYFSYSNSWYWSSSSAARDSTIAWSVYFRDGYADRSAKGYGRCNVRCVRGGL